MVQQVGRFRSAGVILDVTGMDVIDSFSVRTLRDLAHMIRLRGAMTVIVGIQPEVAFSMIQLGLRLKDVPTALDLEEGLAYLDSMKGKRKLPGDPLTLASLAAVLLHDVAVSQRQSLLEAEDLGVLFEDLRSLYRREIVLLDAMLSEPQDDQIAPFSPN